MSGVHDTKKHQIPIKFPHPTWRRIEKAAELHNQTPGQFIRDVITIRVADIPLTADDAKIIAERIEQAEKEGRMK